MPTFSHESLSNKKFEEQVLQFWDGLYTYMSNMSMEMNSHRQWNRMRFNSLFEQDDPLSSIIKQWQTIVNYNSNDVYRLLHDNIDVVRTILDSIRTNTTLMLAVFSMTLTRLYTSGYALFNVCLSLMIFLTLLFYLLAYSDQTTYRPIQWLNHIAAFNDDQRLGETINDAVINTLHVSLKMACFYGFYTYLLHSLFGCNIVFIPALLASICAITVKSYLAAVPGCVDLWFVQQRSFSAWILLLAQILPVYIVDHTFYSRITEYRHQVRDDIS
jgi:predicted PurR-regulated permease PerM